jgi:hypothetical protein
MKTGFFGHFLLMKGIVSATHVRQAHALQAQRNQTLAQFMQAAGVLAQWPSLPLSGCEHDTLFAQIAINAGWIARPELEALQARQRSLQLTLGEALVECGYITEASLPNLLSDYQYWNLRRLQQFGQQASTSEFSHELDAFSFTLTQHLLQVYGLHVKPNRAGYGTPPQTASWCWHIEVAERRVCFIVPDTGAGIERLLARAELIASLNLASLPVTATGNASNMPTAMAPPDFFTGLLTHMLADSAGYSLRRTEPPAAGDAQADLQTGYFHCSYSVEGDLFDMYASSF